jgi:hypothetical protein
MPPLPLPVCPCVTRHAPRPLAFQVHHILPKSWGGPNIAANEATICGTCHDNVHHALDQAVAVAYGPTGTGTLTSDQIDMIVKPYTAYARTLIRRAIEAAL